MGARFELPSAATRTLPGLLLHLSQLECWAGNRDLASGYADESLELSGRAGLVFDEVLVDVCPALVDAHRGEADESRGEEALGRPWPLATAKRARGLVAAARGDVDSTRVAFDHAPSWHEQLPMPFERARTLLAKSRVERRAERRTVELRQSGHEVNPDALRYLNHLSDLLFVMARAEVGGPEAPSRPQP